LKDVSVVINLHLKSDEMKKVAIPVHNGKLSESFGMCDYYRIFEIDGEIINSNETKLPPVRIINMPDWISGEGITDLIVHKIEKSIISLFSAYKINLFVGVCINSPEVLIEDYLNGNLLSDESIIKEITG